MNACESVARAWHDGSDHAADGEPFGGPLCNCLAMAGRIVPMLAEAFNDGMTSGILAQSYVPNPYEEDRHVDQ